MIHRSINQNSYKSCRFVPKMRKKRSNFKRLKIIVKHNPFIIWAIAWVSIIPSIGSVLVLNYLYIHIEKLMNIDFLSFQISFSYIFLTAILMGLALMPTTLIAILSGFLFGWLSFPLLVIAYSIAAVIGYKLGTSLDENSLDILLEKYPKTKKIIREKESEMSQLIFYLRLSPLIPFALSNLLFALLRSDLKKVVLVGLLGMMPRTMVAFITGMMATSLLNALNEGTNFFHLFTIGLLLLVSIWGLYRVINKYVKG